jgi:hypothetical protein
MNDVMLKFEMRYHKIHIRQQMLTVGSGYPTTILTSVAIVTDFTIVVIGAIFPSND